MAIALIGAMVIGTIAAGVVWVAQEGHPAGDRVVGALAAGGATFLGVATLAFVIGGFLSG
ncbi:hypothetical protein [Streptomyces sp. NPDC058457]|uniref:hypothetical protein n=1 Tax=Streptomyces sp. NPDC058457 TaxID=3346507 RepID=UPI00364A62D8